MNFKIHFKKTTQSEENPPKYQTKGKSLEKFMISFKKQRRKAVLSQKNFNLLVISLKNEVMLKT